MPIDWSRRRSAPAPGDRGDPLAVAVAAALLLILLGAVAYLLSSPTVSTVISRALYLLFGAQ